MPLGKKKCKLVYLLVFSLFFYLESKLFTCLKYRIFTEVKSLGFGLRRLSSTLGFVAEGLGTRYDILHAQVSSSLR